MNWVVYCFSITLLLGACKTRVQDKLSVKETALAQNPSLQRTILYINEDECVGTCAEPTDSPQIGPEQQGWRQKALALQKKSQILATEALQAAKDSQTFMIAKDGVIVLFDGMASIARLSYGAFLDGASQLYAKEVGESPPADTWKALSIQLNKSATANRQSLGQLKKDWRTTKAHNYLVDAIDCVANWKAKQAAGECQIKFPSGETVEIPDSGRDYAPFANTTQSFFHEKALQLMVTFSNRTNLEKYRDFVTITDKNDQEIGKYTGSKLAGKTIEIPGNMVNIRLTTDYNTATFGYQIIKIVALEPKPVE